MRRSRLEGRDCSVFKPGDAAYSANGGKPVVLDADQISDYAADSVVRVQAAGLIQGDEANYFHPLDGANRAEAAVIMDRVMQTYQL